MRCSGTDFFSENCRVNYFKTTRANSLKISEHFVYAMKFAIMILRSVVPPRTGSKTVLYEFTCFCICGPARPATTISCLKRQGSSYNAPISEISTAGVVSFPMKVPYPVCTTNRRLRNACKKQAKTSSSSVRVWLRMRLFRKQLRWTSCRPRGVREPKNSLRLPSPTFSKFPTLVSDPSHSIHSATVMKS